VGELRHGRTPDHIWNNRWRQLQAILRQTPTCVQSKQEPTPTIKGTLAVDEILSVRNMSKTYGGVCVLDGVDFSLRKGEVHALVGENGAGKSTLIKAIAGVVQPDPGSEIIFDGERIPHMTATRSRQLGISVIYQDISLFPNLSVAENIYTGIKRGGVHDRRQMHTIALQAIAKLGLPIDPEALLGDISVGQQQLVAIARAIIFQAKVIVMDEPTASLSSSEVEMLFRLIRSLQKDGIGIIYISHKFDEVFELADRISVLRDGSLVACGDSSEFDQTRLIQLMVGRELRFIPYHNQGEAGDTLFEVRNLTCEPLFRDVSFDVKRGEILGITGLVGAGRSEVARAIFGIHKVQSGDMYLLGRPVRVRSVRDAIRHGICYLPEDRREQGLFMLHSMRANTTAASMSKILNRFHLISARKELAVAQHYIEQLSIRPASPELNVTHFSGGNQQKVLVARWLNASPKLLIVDEVTSGVDVGVKTEIHKLLRELAASGVAIVLISSDLPEIFAVSDRIVIMRSGHVVNTVEVGHATQESILAKSMLAGEA